MVFTIKKISEVKIKYLLFGLGYFPWVLSWMFTSSYYKDFIHPYAIIEMWKYIGGAFLILKLLKDKVFNRWMLFLGIVIITIGAIVSHENDNASFVFYSMLLIVVSFNLDLEWLVKTTMHCQIFSLSVTVISSLLGIIPNDIVLSTAGGIIRVREGLGYTYTTFAPNFLLSIAIEWFFLSRRKKRRHIIIQAFIITIINIYFYLKTETRTSVILVFIIVFLKIIDVLKKSSKVKYKFLSENIFIIMGIASIVISTFYTPSIRWMNILNTLLSQRIRFAQAGLSQWGISVFGTPVIWNPSDGTYNYIDSSYINILICYGIVVFLIVIIGLTISVRYACRSNKHELVVAFVIWGIRAFIDPQLYLIWFNPFMFCIGTAVLIHLKSVRKGHKNAFNNMCI